MLRKILTLITVICISLSVLSCSKGQDLQATPTDKWTGTYVWTNEKTGEFKVAVVEGAGDQKVRFSLKSVRATEEFEGLAKSNSGRYVVLNTGPRCFKIGLSAQNDKVTIDDMWTDGGGSRGENWTGKYMKLAEGEMVPEFGDPRWNGEYVCEELGQSVSIYGTRENFVLLSYTTIEEEETVNHELKCLEPEPSKAVYTQDQRLVIVEILSSNTQIKITDAYMDDSENKGISGIYTRRAEEEPHA